MPFMRVLPVAGLLIIAATLSAPAEPSDCAPGLVAGQPKAYPAPFLLEGYMTLPGSGRDWAICLPVGPGSPRALQDLDGAVAILSSLDVLGPWFAGLIADSGVRLCVEHEMVGGRGWFEPETRTLSVSSTLSPADMVLVLAHELRHIDQWRRGFQLSLDVTATEHVRQTYALEADASAVLAWVGWTAGQEGHDGIWTATLDLDRYRDIAVAFDTEMTETASPTAALLAAFRAWYASPWRIDSYWRSACGNYLDRLDDLHRPAGQALLPSGRLNRLCEVPGLGNYGCASSPEIAMEPGVAVR
jgi:hypothetical protein